MYGRDPPRLLSYEPSSSKLATLDQALVEQDTMLSLVCTYLQDAQQAMKLYYDKHHRHVVFSPRDYVWIRLQHCRQLSLTTSKCHKLSPKFYGPFPLLETIGTVAYHLQLPPDAKLHDDFQVSQLKAFTGDSPLLHTPLLLLQEGWVLSTPAQVLQARKIQGDWEILVQWVDTDPMDTTLEPLASFKALYPTFELEDKLFL
ncbi:uncharacterized protein [Aristolochia californica]|uniref:uncharacterized protein n=1 Tax=Aristolochia californica TaxID=171875 RepID=UPI0035E19BED